MKIVSLTFIALVYSVTVFPAGLSVLTSVYPVYIFTRNVVGETPGITLNLLLSPEKGGPHNYALTPGDLEKIAGADLLIINGGGLEGFLERIKKDIQSRLLIVDSSEGIKLIRADAGSGGHDFTNPHFFVSPQQAIIQVRNIARALRTADPPNAGKYQENAGQFIEKLERLTKEMKQRIQRFDNKKIITFHNAFAYFARDLGLVVVGVIENNPGQQPSAGELADLVRTIKRRQVKAVFSEPQFSAELAGVLVRETGIGLYRLDPMATGNDYQADAYLRVMKKNLRILVDALGE